MNFLLQRERRISNMNKFLYETHSHTKEASACGRVSGDDYIDYMIERGFSGMIFTDHFLNGNTAIARALPWEEKISLYTSGYKKACAAAKGKDFDVLFGVEYNFEGDEYLIYGIDEKWLIENEDIMSLSRKGVYDRVHEAGAVMIQAHPYRERDYLSEIRLTPEICDGIEVYNAANPDNQNALAYIYAEKLKVPMTAGSDIHFFYEGPMGGMLLPERIKDSGEYVEALFRNEAVPVRVENGEIIRVEDIPELVSPKNPPTLKVINISFS